MKLYLIRHAIAAERNAARWPDDARRPLTEAGRRRFGRIARGLAAIGIDVEHLLSSAYRRAWETAELLTLEAGWPDPRRCEALESGDSHAIREALGAFDMHQSVAIVGHEPVLSELASYLLTGDDDRVDLDFKKGGVLALSFAGKVVPGGATLDWYLTPKLVRPVRR